MQSSSRRRILSPTLAGASPATDAIYARVLQVINEFLPVSELAGRLLGLPVLRQFGLVENDKVDHFLALAFGKKRGRADGAVNRPEENRIRGDVKAPRPRRVKK